MLQIKKFDDRSWEGKHRGNTWDSKIYRIYNPATHKVVESRNATFLETPAYPPNTPDVRSFLDEMEDIDYVTDVLTFTSLGDNTRNNSIAKPEAQDYMFDLAREVQRYNVRLHAQLDATCASAGDSGVAPAEPLKNSPDGPEQTGTGARRTRASRRCTCVSIAGASASQGGYPRRYS